MNTGQMLLVAAVALVFSTGMAHAENFKSPKECVPGTRVTHDSLGVSGTLVRDDAESQMCTFVEDGSGRKRYALYWMLRAAGTSPETNDKLVPGTYECFAGNPNKYTFMDLRITGANTYQWGGVQGHFRLDDRTKKIVFDSGPLVKVTAKLLAGPRVGMNTDRGSSFGTSCGLRR
jgi:hypothetical protein